MSKQSVCGGGQRPTLGCACGFIAKGAPREAKKHMRMHRKKCELSADIRIETSNPLQNGRDGITYVRVIMSTREDQTVISSIEGSKCGVCGVSTQGRKIRSLWNNALCEECGEESEEEDD